MKATGFRFKINDISKKIDRIDSKLKELEKYIKENKVEPIRYKIPYDNENTNVSYEKTNARNSTF